MCRGASLKGAVAHVTIQYIRMQPKRYDALVDAAGNSKSNNVLTKPARNCAAGHLRREIRCKCLEWKSIEQGHPAPRRAA
jgi:hypothetical protein